MDEHNEKAGRKTCFFARKTTIFSGVSMTVCKSNFYNKNNLAFFLIQNRHKRVLKCMFTTAFVCDIMNYNKM